MRGRGRGRRKGVAPRSQQYIIIKLTFIYSSLSLQPFLSLHLPHARNCIFSLALLILLFFFSQSLTSYGFFCGYQLISSRPNLPTYMHAFFFFLNFNRIEIGYIMQHFEDLESVRNNIVVKVQEQNFPTRTFYEEIITKKFSHPCLTSFHLISSYFNTKQNNSDYISEIQLIITIKYKKIKL